MACQKYEKLSCFFWDKNQPNDLARLSKVTSTGRYRQALCCKLRLQIADFSVGIAL